MSIYAYGIHTICKRGEMSRSKPGIPPTYTIRILRFRLIQRESVRGKTQPPTWESEGIVYSVIAPSPWNDRSGYETAMRDVSEHLPTDYPYIGRIPEGQIGTWILKSGVVRTNLKITTVRMLYPECKRMPKEIAWDYVRDRM